MWDGLELNQHVTGPTHRHGNSVDEVFPEESLRPFRTRAELQLTETVEAFSGGLEAKSLLFT